MLCSVDMSGRPELRSMDSRSTESSPSFQTPAFDAAEYSHLLQGLSSQARNAEGARAAASEEARPKGVKRLQRFEVEKKKKADSSEGGAEQEEEEEEKEVDPNEGDDLRPKKRPSKKKNKCTSESVDEEKKSKKKKKDDDEDEDEADLMGIQEAWHLMSQKFHACGLLVWRSLPGRPRNASELPDLRSKAQEKLMPAKAERERQARRRRRPGDLVGRNGNMSLLLMTFSP